MTAAKATVEQNAKATGIRKLIHIQANLKAPKGNYNSFAKYSYRSCEDILQAVKPLLKETKTAILLRDEIITAGGTSVALQNGSTQHTDRPYVKAYATLVDGDTGDIIWETSAMAREPLAKKGADDSQITGAASSYARKYALSGLLAIDNERDADRQPYASAYAAPQAQQRRPQAQY